MCAWALRLSGIHQVVLGARHADLHRVDLGEYSLEKFAALLGYSCELVEGVRQQECIALRERWGRTSRLGRALRGAPRRADAIPYSSSADRRYLRAAASARHGCAA